MPMVLYMGAITRFTHLSYSRPHKNIQACNIISQSDKPEQANCCHCDIALK